MAENFSERYKWPWLLIFIYIIVVIGAYVIQFHDHEFSLDPSEWGTLGDYFGGLLNPLASLMALYFLIKTYLSQKEELAATKNALQESARQQGISASAQENLAILQEKSLVASEKLMIAQVTGLEITSMYEDIRFWCLEMDKCTVAMGNNRATFDLHGKNLFTDEDIKHYRMQCLNRVLKIQDEITTVRAGLAKYKAPAQ
ncbi:hypothetical protein [Pseudomonas ovata]|uniref:hypothetical protein n=1 Tax=Pseudomonas ovata TaxID=1839709 RepID=UPI00126019C9|nr:hypothetical protein [Pseudomonas ovata]